ncbi:MULTISPECIES: hypothetical protein [unclassified Spirillospora]|uniref:hypothetical protein n=1 Tax=unclassified Spirillospora TaxID=2642701 RepID=UPI003710696B
MRAAPSLLLALFCVLFGSLLAFTIDDETNSDAWMLQIFGVVLIAGGALGLLVSLIATWNARRAGEGDDPVPGGDGLSR